MIIVKAGDTLSGLAVRTGVSVDTLKRLNNLTSDFISIGQTLNTGGSVPVPVGVKLSYPVQPRSQYKIDTTFCDTYYQRLFNTYHTGYDWNGVGGGETDYGDNIYAIYNGVVSDVAQGQGKWGLVIRIWHTDLKFYSRYAHLMERPNRALVRTGQVVKRGQLIGHMGNAYGAWITHLHQDFMLPVPGTPFDYWRVGLDAASLADVNKHYIDPAKVFAKYGVV